LNRPYKLFSDPVHGFIEVPRRLLLDLIQTHEVQRLRRIRQLGVGYLVFPGAEHTRFTHALGAMALMHDTLNILAEKGTPISEEEHLGALAAALLHDVGHGPFSHTLEHELISDFHHEAMSRSLLKALNEQFDGALDLALNIFDDTYKRPFFHQLVSSQLDMDRLDYLRRDSFYTGVVEGRVGVERILKTLRVHPLDGGPDSRIVIETKGIYAVENFLMARRLMYWQVYLHKTVLAGDQVLQALFRRARQHLREGSTAAVAGVAPALRYFLAGQIDGSMVYDTAVRRHFCDLDDTDVLYSLKQWMRSDDRILADLARRFIERDFFRTTFLDEPLATEQMESWQYRIADWLIQSGLAKAQRARQDASYYLTLDYSRHSAYERIENSIAVMERDGTLRELSETADTAAIAALTDFVVKPYVCYPKEVPF
jgi:HD superfamily phosphohydrolase